MDATTDFPEDDPGEGGSKDASLRSGDRHLSLAEYLEILDVLKDFIGPLKSKPRAKIDATLEIASAMGKNPDALFKFLMITRGREENTYGSADQVMADFLEDFRKFRVLDAIAFGVETELI